jgi:hypothetical protein
MAERTGNAQAPDDRNWLRIQALELRVQTIRSVSARFTLHVFLPSFLPENAGEIAHGQVVEAGNSPEQSDDLKGQADS